MTASEDTRSSESGRVMSAAVLLFGRRLVVTLLGAVANAVAARLLGVRDFGDLSAALAVYYFLVAMGDFGFSLVLGRALAAEPEARPVIVRSAARLQVALTTALTLGAIAYGWIVWNADLRFVALLALSPAILFSGLTGFRQVYLVLHRVRTMAALDLSTAVAQTAAVILAALLSFGPVGIAVAMSAASCVNSAVGAVIASRLVGKARATWAATIAVVREAGPLGIMAVLSTAYFTIDVIVLGWIADAVSIGYYAAAVKVLSILVSLPGIVMTAMLPAVTRARAAGDEDVAGPVWHLLVSTVIPACLVIGVCAPLIVRLLYGAEFAPAAGSLAVLALAGALATASNLVSTLLVAERRGVAMAVQNAVLLVVNVALNLGLVPRFGVIASAWATVATELLVVVAGMFLLGRGAIEHLRGWGAVSIRPVVVAAVTFVCPALLLGRDSLAALFVGLGLFVIGMTALGAWPAELMSMVRRRTVS